MWNASVPMIPGTIALAVIPCRPPSIASVFVRPSRPGLRRRVRRLAEAAERSGDRGHVDDPAPPPLLHVRPDRLRAVERAGQVDAQVALPERRLLVGELADVVERARVVDEDVDRAELVDRARDRGGDLVAIGDVAA